MMDVERIYRATPIGGVEAQEIALVLGIPGVGTYPAHDPALALYEPLAGGTIPLAEARPFLRALRTAQGVTLDDADAWATRKWSELRPGLAANARPVRLVWDDLRGDAECAEATTLLDAARECVDRGTLEFWGRVLNAVASTRLFPAARLGEGSRRLGELPTSPGPFDLFEFMRALPYGVHFALWGEPEDGRLEYRDLPDFMRWREWIAGPVARLEAELGTWVYDFADHDGVFDDDAAHRLLALHFLASCLPDCPFVRYLTESSGANGVEELRQSLLDPTSYSVPFFPWDAFGGGEARAIRSDFRALAAPKVRAFALDGITALEALREACLAGIGDEVRFVFPWSAPSQGWLRDATRHNSSWSFHRGWNGAAAFVRGADTLALYYTEKIGLSDEALALGVAAEDAGTKVTALTDVGGVYEFFQSEATRRGFRPERG